MPLQQENQTSRSKSIEQKFSNKVVTKNEQTITIALCWPRHLRKHCKEMNLDFNQNKQSFSMKAP
jgi:hypothetical protein